MKNGFAKLFWFVFVLVTIASASLGFFTAKISVDHVYATNVLDGGVTGDPRKALIESGERFGQSDEPRDPRNLAFSIVRGLMAGLGLAMIIMFLYAGFLWFSARGNDDQVKKAKTTLRNAVIGMLIIGFSYALVTFVFRSVFKPVVESVPLPVSEESQK